MILIFTIALTGIVIALINRSELLLSFICMLIENFRKNSKIKFEEFIADFTWDFNPNDTNENSDESYRNLLKSVFVFDPAAHDYDKERFKIKF